MESDPKHFKIVETANNQHMADSGTCALCADAYTFGNRVIAEYKESGGYIITEPFNLCDKCFQKHDNRVRTNQKQKTITDY